MSLIVQKFGGTSLANPQLILQAAEKIAATQRQGHEVVVVVSAMAGTTNQLVTWANNISSSAGQAEYDVVLSAGETITAGLLALALQKQGLESRSWTAAQLPIRTDRLHGEATITHIATDDLLAFAKRGGVSVITGFQGVTPEGRLTTLGRGGSDTTAVVLAGFLNASRCDIYTDVDGVYTADPRFVEDAQKIEHLSYEDMLLLSSNGAKVLHPQAVYAAQKHHVPLRVLSSFSFEPGTLISLNGGQENHLFGLTYTLDWMLAESSQPFADVSLFESHDITLQERQAPLYRAAFLPKHLETVRAKGLRSAAYSKVKENLAAISFMTSACNKTHMRTLRLRFLGALSDPEMPPIQLRATRAHQWRLWVDQDHLPATLRFIHRRLHTPETI